MATPEPTHDGGQSGETPPTGDTNNSGLVSPLLKVVGYKQLLLLARYPLNTATVFLSQFIFFALIFFGGRAVGGPQITESLDGLIVGFFLWTLSTVGFRGLADNVMDEARWGTLERLYMSPYRLETVMAVKTFVNVCYSFAYSVIFLLAMLLVTGRWLHIDPLTVTVLAVLTLVPVVGIGLVAAGLAVLYKRIENLFSLVVFGFVGLIAAPVESLPLLKLFPMTQGSYLMRRAMEDGVRLWNLPTVELVWLVVPACLYLLGGFYAFSRMQSRARKRGVMGHY